MELARIHRHFKALKIPKNYVSRLRYDSFELGGSWRPAEREVGYLFLSPAAPLDDSISLIIFARYQHDTFLVEVPYWGSFGRATVTGYEMQSPFSERDDSFWGEIPGLVSTESFLADKDDQDIAMTMNLLAHDSAEQLKYPDFDEVIFLSALSPESSSESSDCAHWKELCTLLADDWIGLSAKFATQVCFKTDGINCPLCRTSAVSFRSERPSRLECIMKTSIKIELHPGIPLILSVSWGGKYERNILTGPGSDLPTFANVAYGAGSEIALPHVKQLLNYCCEAHQYCNALKRAEDSISIILIDVEQDCLVRAQSTIAYFALSYVNGAETIFKTTVDNFVTLQRPGAIREIDSLPTVIAAAIDFTRRMDERFLWVDVLCIVQDDLISKHEQIMRMDTIYSNSKLTIINLSGFGANSPLAGLTAFTRAPIATIRYGGPINLYTHSLGPEAIMADCPYETRGWTFQERLLSPRCLYFSSHQAFFQCREGLLTEQKWSYRKNGDFIRHKATGNTGESLLNPLSELVIAASVKTITALLIWQNYADLVTIYTGRQLSFPSDILNAFAGIISFLDRLWAANFQSGLPMTLIDIALLWYPSGQTERRTNAELSPAETRFSHKFPSWSWAGWTGQVNYIFQKSTGLNRPDPLVERISYQGETQLNLSLDKKQSDKFPSWKASVTGSQKSKEPEHSRKIAPSLNFWAKYVSTDQLRLAPPFWEGEHTRILDEEERQCGIFLDNDQLSKSVRSISEVPNEESPVVASPLPRVSTFSRSSTAGSSRILELVIISQISRTLSRRSGFTIYNSEGKFIEPFGEYYSAMLGSWKMLIVLLLSPCEDGHERLAIGLLHEKVVNSLHPVTKNIRLI